MASFLTEVGQVLFCISIGIDIELRWMVQHINSMVTVLVAFDFLENNNKGNDTLYFVNSLDEVGVFCLG